MENNLFRFKKANPDKLSRYGFVKTEDGFCYEKEVLDGQFLCTVTVTETVSTAMTDLATGEVYALYKIPSAAGAFVGAVREAELALLEDIAEKCFDPEIFKFPQTKAVLAHAARYHGDAPEYLWPKFPDNAVLRRRDTEKWYAIVMTVSKAKLGDFEDTPVEIIDLRLPPDEMEKTVDRKTYFPGWHMNKKSWYTIILDGSVSDKELFDRIEISYNLAKK